MDKRRLLPFVRASSLHIGAAAATASLRADLVREYHVEPSEVDRAYAVSRLTPGTNLLALYALLGHRLGGWRLATLAVAVGALVPASLALLVAVAYSHLDWPVLARVMSGARAGGVAVFIGAAVRLIRPQINLRPAVGLGLAGALALVSFWTPVSLFFVLLVAAAFGAAWLRP